MSCASCEEAVVLAWILHGKMSSNVREGKTDDGRMCFSLVPKGHWHPVDGMLLMCLVERKTSMAGEG